MFKNILVITTIYLIGFVVSSEAQEKQCWRGTVEVEHRHNYDKINKKEIPAGYGEEGSKISRNIHLKIDFFTEPGKKDVILGKEIYGSLLDKLVDKWQWKYATCLKRVKPGKMKQEVQISPGSSHDEEQITEADLFEDNLNFSIDVDMNLETKKYSIRSLGISGLKWIGSHTQKRRYKTVDRSTCKTESFKDDYGPIDYLEPGSPGYFGGSYEGYAVNVNTIIGSKTTNCADGELRPDNELIRKIEESCAMATPFIKTIYHI